MRNLGGILGNHMIPVFTAVFGHQEAVQMVTQRAREALNDQRETARRALLHQKGELLDATHQHEAACAANSSQCFWQEILRRTIV